jgi:hypothetical protein
MNASQLLDFTNALQLSDSGVIWCVNVLLQVTLVAALALTTSAFFRRSSAVRYGILCCGLGLSLLCPLSVLCLQTCGVGLIAVSLQSERASSITNQLANDLSSLPAEAFAGSVNTREPSSPYMPSQKLAASWPHEMDVLVSQGKSGHAGDHAEFGTAMESLETGNAEHLLSQLLPVPPNLEATSNNVNRWTQIARLTVPPLIVVWLAVSMALLLRLAVGWSRVAAILRDARPIDDSRVRLAYRRACEALNVSDSLADLRFSHRIAGPLAAGWRCPQIVLPETLTDRISSEQLHEILVMR